MKNFKSLFSNIRLGFRGRFSREIEFLTTFMRPALSMAPAFRGTLEMTSVRLAAFSIVVIGLLAHPAVGRAETESIRTFVNAVNRGNSKQEVHDLHIQYNNPLDRVPTVLSGAPGGAPPTLTVNRNPKQLDVEFAGKMDTAESITISATTAAGSLSILSWWWTDKDKNPVTRTCLFTDENNKVKKGEITEYGPTLHGDETICDDAPDDYTIWNKEHHWGGKDRIKKKVEISMDIRKLLANAPAAMNKDDLINNIKLAIKQWTVCTDPATRGSLPKAGIGGNPRNDGAGKDPAVMGPGKIHKDHGKGKKFRSLTWRECDATLVKYPKGLSIRLIKDGTEAEGNITVEWDAHLKDVKGIGKPEADPDDPDKTKKASIKIHTQDADVKWHLAKDTDADGFITNKDNDTVPKDELDFYSIFKHEIGHTLCFVHAGKTDDAEFGMALPFEESLFPNAEDRSPFATAVGDDFEGGRESVIFASDRPGGYGGFDLWIGTWTKEGWRITNLGPAVNSAADELDPHLASDGTLLLFSSNRGGPEKLFHLYQSTLDLTEGRWRPAKPLERVNSPYQERHPSLTANMRTLYFASNRPGGAGGWDIWTAEWIPGLGFSSPINFGAPINTAANEIDPAISGDGALLIFSSDRTGGHGGFDLWRTQLRSGWSEPRNLGSAINTASDEREPSLRLDNAYLVFASNRSSRGLELFESQIVSVPPPPPVITGLTPTIGAQGTRISGVVTGSNLSGVTSVTFSGTGVTVEVQPGGTAIQIPITVTIARDATPGAHSITVMASAGSATLNSAFTVQRANVPVTAPQPIPEVEQGAIHSGYVILTPDANSPAPISTMTFGTVRGGMVQSHSGMFPGPMTTDASLLVEVIPGIERALGVVIANPNSGTNTITLTLRDNNGLAAAPAMTIILQPEQQLARFLNDLFSPDVIGAAFQGSFSLQSSMPFAVLGLRFLGTEFSIWPVSGTVTSAGVPPRTLAGGTTPNSPLQGMIGGPTAILFLQFVMGGGWASQIALVNAGKDTITGRLDVFDASGNPMAVKLNGQTQSTFTYLIPAGGTFVLAPRDTNGQSPF